jgi:hypothetical protein
VDYLFSLLQLVGGNIDSLPEPWRTRAIAVVAILAAVLLIASAACSFVNKSIRQLQESGVKISPKALKAAAVVNVLGANFDKAAQLLRGGRGPSLPPGAPAFQK